MYNFSVYHQAWKNKNFTIKSLNSLTKLYPGVNIRLISDGGENFSDVANTFNAEFIYDTFNTGVYCDLNPKVIEKKHIYGWNKEEAFIYLKRIYDFCLSINTKYILVSEDDINFNKKFTINEQDFDLTGRIPANYFPEDFLIYLKKFYPNHNLEQWGCCGGNFIKRISFIHCYENCYDFLFNNYDNIITNIFYKLGWADVLFNILFGLNSLKYINNYDYSELDQNFPIFHDKISPRIRND
jgi:hypothetical protein